MDDQTIQIDRMPAATTAESAWEVGLKLESAFRDAVSAERRASLAQGKPVPVTRDDGTVEWLFPDGTRHQGPV